MSENASSAEIAIAADDREMARADALERIRIQASIADAALKSAILVNGGAIVALFTFIGNLTAKAGSQSLTTSSLWTSFALFVSGLVAALMAYLFAFLSQDNFYTVSMKEFWRAQNVVHKATRPTGATQEELLLFGRGQAFFMIAIVLAVVAVICFAFGSAFALYGVLI